MIVGALLLSAVVVVTFLSRFGGSRSDSGGDKPPHSAPTGDDWIHTDGLSLGIGDLDAAALKQGVTSDKKCAEWCASNYHQFTPYWAQWSSDTKTCACFSEDQRQSRMGECYSDGIPNRKFMRDPNMELPTNKCPINFQLSTCHQERMPGFPPKDAQPFKSDVKADSSAGCAGTCEASGADAAAWVEDSSADFCHCYRNWKDPYRCFSSHDLIEAGTLFDFWTLPGQSACPPDNISKLPECI